MKKFLAFSLLLFFGLRLQAEEKIITTSDGVGLYVNVKGSGTPVLYLHGGPGSGSYWLEKFFGEFMEDHYTMIYLDQRGVGRSAGNGDTDYSLERMLLDFEEIRAALGYESWITMGHSFGGILQMAYVSQFPQSVKGMIMVNCTLNISESLCESWGPKAAEFAGKPNKPCPEDPTKLNDVFAYHINNLREADAFWKMAYKDPENEKIMDATFGEINNWNHSFSGLALSMPDYWKDYRKLSENVQVPVLFFHGSKDWMVGPAHYKNIKFPQALMWESEVGHMPFMEATADLQLAILTFKDQYKL